MWNTMKAYKKLRLKLVIEAVYNRYDQLKNPNLGWEVHVLQHLLRGHQEEQFAPWALIPTSPDYVWVETWNPTKILTTKIYEGDGYPS